MEKPAIEGGNPVRDDFLPLCKPTIEEEEINAVTEILKSGWLTTGPKVKEFERNFSEYVNSKNSIALNSCTGALHSALSAYDIKEGDEVIVPTLTFVASAHVVTWLKAKPVLIDSEEGNFNMNVKKIEEKITPNTKVIMPVHYGGHPCEMDEILNIAKKYNLKIIEDAAHAVGSEYKGKKIGSIGDVTCFSFYVIKNMTTAEGGMVTTNDDLIADKIRKRIYFGVDKDAFDRYKDKGNWYYEIVSQGYKYNMDSLQGALGVEQLKKLDKFNEKRKQLAQHYLKRFSELDYIKTQEVKSYVKHSWHLFPILIDFDKLKINRNEFIEALKAEKIGTSVHFIPLHLHPFYQKEYGYKEGDFPVAEKIYKNLITIPLFPKMTLDDVDSVVNAIKKIWNYYKK